MEKTMKARVQHKHDVEANWLKATNFTPLASEIIVYDPDENYDYPRIKIGDGKTNINTLPFVTKDYAKISDIPTKPEDIGALPDSTVIPTVPTKISAFENDKGYLTQHQSLDAYAKTADLGELATKDSLTASDVGALPDTTKIPSTLSDLIADSTHRTVTDTEKDTWNAKANTSDIPTKVSDLTNDKGYITSYTETDPTVPSWAKAATKPSYTASEVGALPSTTKIPGALSDLNEDTTHRVVTDAEKEAWNAKSNFSGNYADLNGKPTIPTVPTKVSAFENDAKYLTTFTETDPTVPDWAKAKEKPTYTASEVGALPDSTEIPSKLSDLSEDTTHRLVTDTEKTIWNAKSNFSGSYNDLTNKPTIPSIAGLASTTYVDNAVKNKVDKDGNKVLSTNDYTTAEKNKLANIAAGAEVNVNADWNATSGDAQILNKPTLGSMAAKNSVAKSDLASEVQTSLGKADSALQPGDISDWAKQTSKPSYTKNEVGLGNVDNTSDTNKPVSTAQASAIADAKKAGTDAQSNLNAHANNKSNPHGVTKTQVGLSNVDNVKQYSASNPPVVVQSEAPTDTSVIWVDPDDNSGDEISDAERLKWESFITTELAKRGQLSPEFASSIEECTDTTKLYVLPDGFIYAYQYVEATGPSYTNLAGTITYDRRLSSSGKASSSAIAGAAYTDFIPAKKGQKVYIKNFDVLTDFTSSAYPYICYYTGASDSNVVSTGVYDRPSWMLMDSECMRQEDDGTLVYNAFMASGYSKNTGSPSVGQHQLADTITHIRISGWYEEGKEIIVTVDEEITEGGSGGYAWVNTGHAFVPADYEDRILALEDHADAIPESRIKAIEAALNEPAPADYSGNILYGKKWVACGDSFTANGYNASDGFDESVYIYQDGRFAGRYKVYPNIIGLRNNMNIVNLATGGQTMAQSSNSFMSRYTTIDADADYITIMLGINDKVQGLAVGTLEDSTNTTFCGAFNIAMEHILENHPFAHIGIMVSHGTNEEIMEATRGIAERWGVPYLDYGSPQVPLMNRYTGRNVCAKAQQIREKNFCVASDGTTVTNGHPNTAAHEFESTFIEAWLRTL